jgi:hypothetical protein
MRPGDRHRRHPVHVSPDREWLPVAAPYLLDRPHLEALLRRMYTPHCRRRDTQHHQGSRLGAAFCAARPARSVLRWGRTRRQCRRGLLDGPFLDGHSGTSDRLLVAQLPQHAFERCDVGRSPERSAARLKARSRCLSAVHRLSDSPNGVALAFEHLAAHRVHRLAHGAGLDAKHAKPVGDHPDVVSGREGAQPEVEVFYLGVRSLSRPRALQALSHRDDLNTSARIRLSGRAGARRSGSSSGPSPCRPSRPACRNFGLTRGNSVPGWPASECQNERRGPLGPPNTGRRSRLPSSSGLPVAQSGICGPQPATHSGCLSGSQVLTLQPRNGGDPITLAPTRAGARSARVGAATAAPTVISAASGKYPYSSSGASVSSREKPPADAHVERLRAGLVEQRGLGDVGIGEVVDVPESCARSSRSSGVPSDPVIASAGPPPSHTATRRIRRARGGGGIFSAMRATASTRVARSLSSSLNASCAARQASAVERSGVRRPSRGTGRWRCRTRSSSRHAPMRPARMSKTRRNVPCMPRRSRAGTRRPASPRRRRQTSAPPPAAGATGGGEHVDGLGQQHHVASRSMTASWSSKPRRAPGAAG